MDIESSVIEQFQKLAPMLTEDLLISLSNKGTLNRAKKDLEKMRNNISFQRKEDGTIIGLLGEEAVITLADHVADCTCSCPSMGVCRHLITVLLYGKEQYEAGKQKVEEQTKEEQEVKTEQGVKEKQEIKEKQRIKTEQEIKEKQETKAEKGIKEEQEIKVKNRKKGENAEQETNTQKTENTEQKTNTKTEIKSEIEIGQKEIEKNTESEINAELEINTESKIDTEKRIKEKKIKTKTETTDSALQREQKSSEDFKELNQISPEELKKLVGKKNYSSLLLSIRKKNEAEFHYGELLQVVIKSQNAMVYFPLTNSIEGSICNCKERGICRHKSYALISYLMNECNLSLFLEEEVLEIGQEEIDFLEQVLEQITSYLERGMASLTEEVIKETERNYIRAYGMKFFRLAEEFKILSSDFALYFAKNVAFSNTKTMHLICKIYNRVSTLLKTKDGVKRNILIGKRKEESYQMDELTLIGLGTIAKMTKRNDLLISAYFYAEDIKEMLILSTLRTPEHVESSKTYLYNTGLVWAEEMTFRRVSMNKVTLRNAVITSGRISGTKNTNCKVNEVTKEDDIKEIAIQDFKTLRENLRKHSYQYFAPYSESNTIYLIKPYDIGTPEYDSIRQSIRFSAYDKTGEEVVFEIRYNEASKSAIESLEDKKRRPKFDYLLGSFKEKNGKLHAAYLSGMAQGKICELYFKDVIRR